MAKEDYLIKLSMMQQEAEKLQEQVQIINQQIAEFEVLKLSLGNIGENKEILANLGKGVFIKSEIKDKELFVNIGQGIVVRKNADEACKIIDKQISELGELKRNILQEIEKINSNLQELLEEARKES
jgi:prefoldin alpha subunit